MDFKHNPWTILFVISMCFSLNLHLCTGLGTDRISQNQSLSGDQTLLSAKGIFRLGFFNPGNTSNYYIGIWYNRISKRTIVWVANREKPVSNIYSSELRILDRNLVLFNELKVPIWSSGLNSTALGGPLEVVLLDNGNLVLREEPNASLVEPLWQSFDHPNDILLPGAKLGFNKITRKETFLTSWRNREDPAPGLFSLSLDPRGCQFRLLFNFSIIDWLSGPCDGHSFLATPEMEFFNFTFIDNANESYFTYSPYSIGDYIVLDAGGQIQQRRWLVSYNLWHVLWAQPRAQREVYAYCGPFGSLIMTTQPFCDCLPGFGPRYADDWNSEVFSGGCARRTSLQCENSSLVNGPIDRFLEVYNVNAPDDAQHEAVGNVMECQSKCLSDCSCTAFTYYNEQCSTWHGELLNLNQLETNDPQAQTLFIRLAASEFSSSKDNKGVVIGAIMGSLVILAGLSIIFFVIFKRRKRSVEVGTTVAGSLIAFTYRFLQTRTKNFSEKLGRGGFGSVFKGMLPDSTIVAVKKLESINQGEKQFRTEVSTIGLIHHVNLVRLRGFCSEGTKKLLVYDYMPNGSLDSHLFKNKLGSKKVLDWKTRYQIALGTARGLTYLHEKCRDCIIHCDGNPEKILLDVDYCPKVTEFGMAKLIGRDFSKVLTTMRGTIGYLAPEWISGVAITSKADVYSYGMMLFELVSGRRNAKQSEDGRIEFFPLWAVTQLVNGGDVLSLLDPWLEEKADAEEVATVCKVACWCIQDDESQRPTMGEVVHILEGVSNVDVPPIPRSLQMLFDNMEHRVLFTESSSSHRSHF